MATARKPRLTKIAVATNGEFGSPFADNFGQTHQGYHLMGKEYRELFLEALHDFFTRLKHHVYIAGQPGVGKTWTVEHMAEQYPNVVLLTIKQSMTPWAFMKALAVALFKLNGTGLKLVIYIDDFNAIFKANSEFLDMFKNAMDKKSGDKIEYNKSLGAQLDQADPIEKEAIEFWKSLNPHRTGFEIPFKGQVRFIFTMNTTLPSEQDVAKEKQGSDAWIKLNNRNAIRSRVRYEDLVMSKEVYWGWIADVLWHEPKMCEGASDEQKFEMLMWLWDNWDSASAHSLRFIEEEMWDIMQQYPKRQQYITRWEKLKG
jgi:hypothetical protein